MHLYGDAVDNYKEQLRRWLVMSHSIGQGICYQVSTNSSIQVSRPSVSPLINMEELINYNNIKEDEYDKVLSLKLGPLDTYNIQGYLADEYEMDIGTPQEDKITKGKDVLNTEERITDPGDRDDRNEGIPDNQKNTQVFTP